MGTFEHPITLIGPNGSQTLEALVDTGATFSAFPSPTLERLGVKPFSVIRVRLANDQIEERRMGQLEATLNGERRPILCLFCPAGSTALIGAHALEAFLLTVDPIGQRLVPREGLLM